MLNNSSTLSQRNKRKLKKEKWSFFAKLLTIYGRKRKDHIFPINRLKIKEHDWIRFVSEHSDCIGSDAIARNRKRKQ